jgi:chemotaxis protein CheX
VIGLTGNAVGTVVVSLSRTTALESAAALLQEKPGSLTEVDSDVVDAIGELTNMIAGGAKAQLEKLSLSVSLPSVICGKNHTVSFPSEATPIEIPFESAWGPISIEVGLVDESECV